MMTFILALCVLFHRYAVAQTSSLPPAPSYAAGRFDSPDTARQQSWMAGRPMRVAWETEYTWVIVYLIKGQDYNNPWKLIENTTDTSGNWTVGEGVTGDYSRPFSFRAVNGTGTKEDLLLGGFYTGQFWIEEDTSTSTTSEITTTLSRTSIGEGSSVISSPGATPSSSTTSSNLTPSAASPTPTTDSTTATSDGSSTLSIGAKAGIGTAAAIVGLCAVALGVFLCSKKRRHSDSPSESMPFAVYEGGNKDLPPYSAAGSQQAGTALGRGQKPVPLDQLRPMNDAPTEVAVNQPLSELEETRRG